MPFLSSEQRKRAINQQWKLYNLLRNDEVELLKRLADVTELQRCAKNGIALIRSAELAEVDADTALQIDENARQYLMDGLPHLPVIVSTGTVEIVRA